MNEQTPMIMVSITGPREAAAAQLARGEAIREDAARNRHVHEIQCMQYMNG